MTIDAIPNYLPDVVRALVAANPVKPATPDLIVFNTDNVPVETMTDLIFEQIGGQEVLGLSRNDIVNGQKITYNPIANTSILGRKYNSQNIFTVPSPSESYFKNFSIKLDSCTPNFGEGTGPLGETVYVDADSEDLIVNVINMSSNDQVEIQILSSGYPTGDIIY